ncbi:MAG: hypothetical protein JWO95_3214 [Verrucomicrobiales bacterium]|nr:hypothetical protein [Verrucomicrobiales bacterium]
MKNILIAVLLGTTVMFGALYLRETKKSNDVRTNTSALEEKVVKLQSAADSNERQKTALREELEQARTEIAANGQPNDPAKQTKNVQATEAASDLATAEKSTPNFNKAIAGMAEEMSKNPELKEMIKSQQKAALGPMTEKNYAKLFAQLNLTSEQSATLKDLIVGKQLAAAEVGMSMLDPTLDTDKRAELTKQIKTANDEADGKIKEYLGDSKYSELQTYEKTLAQRMVINGFKDQLAGGTGVSDAQENDLLKAMQQEQAGFKFTTDFSDKSKFNGDFSSMFTEDKVNTYFQELSQLNNQYLTRAEGILTSDQYSAFKKYLDGQTAMQKMGMQMAAKMFGTGKTAK